jgi:osmotically-inducible protein OsmY
MAYDEYRERERRLTNRESDFERGDFERRTFDRGGSRWPQESSWGYGREYDEGFPDRFERSPARFDREGHPELTGGATEFHPVTRRRYGVDIPGRDFGWQPGGGYGQGSGYLYGWSSGAQGFDSRSYRTAERWPAGSYSLEAWREPVRYYGTSRYLASIPRGRFTGRGPKGYQRSDERIREDVAEELSFNGEIDASGIDVVVSNCVVTLEGEIEDRDQKRLAEDIAEAAPGVREVRNNLKVRHGFFARLFGLDEDERREPARQTR